MTDPGAELRLPEKALDRDRIAREPRPQDLDGGLAALGMLGVIDRGRPALADVLREVVPGHRSTDQIVSAHETAKLVNLSRCSKLDA
jgi:hypothetical protein